MTEQHVSDEMIIAAITGIENRKFATPGVTKLMQNILAAMLELLQRRAEDRQREFDNALV